MTAVDWIALAVVVLFALGGWRRGLVVSALSLAGFVAGAYAGARIAPHLLSGGATSRWTPLVSLVGALLGATVLQALTAIAGSFLRGGLRLTPLRLLDSAGGVVFGAGLGLVLVWIGAATVLLLPGQTSLRRAVLRSEIVSHLNSYVPPRRLLHLLARVDPIPSIAGPPAPSGPPPRGISRDPDVRRAAASVVRVLGTACGVGVEGSGWFVGRREVATAAHVVAGEDDTHVLVPGRPGSLPATVVAFDPHDDVAILRVAAAAAPPLPVRAKAEQGRPVAILGYPENGPLTATPGRIGETATVLTRDAYGRGPVSRTITAIAGVVRHGNSGGPAVDGDGYVQSMVFAARIDAKVGYGVPTALVAKAAREAQRPVSTGACAPG